MDSKVLVKRLSIAWLVILLIAGIVSGIYRVTQIYFDNMGALALFSDYHFTVVLFVLLISAPLLFVIRYHAAIARMKAMFVISTVILIQHAVWILLCIIKWVDSL